MSFDAWQWTLLAIGAAIAGFSKTGIPGTSILFVALFANVLPAKEATGVVLPLLIFADLFSAVVYRKHLAWRRVGGLLPWAVGGVVLGWAALRWIDNAAAARVIGAIIAAMLGLHLWRQRTQSAEELQRVPASLGPVAGVLAGFTTTVANAAGPVMVLYLLAMRLPKLEFLGTSAAFFLAINWIKVPFMVQLGLINPASLALNLWLLPAVAAGALIGRRVVQTVNQRAFETVALSLTAVAALKLLFF
ncbi:MAG: sulfite exporter TauE/SafE family protein [Candidatus Didemnitutus sp.]|nr:sulfite exporter TauE/SafE family protein [Candidatus Didemnitutus sp.]